MPKQNLSRDNYFKQNIAKYGENFIHIKSPKDIQKDAKRKLFKDMVYGNINYDEYGKYFTDPEFVDNLLAIANSLFIEHATTAAALDMYLFYAANPVTEQLARRHFATAKVFEEIYKELNYVKAQNYNIQFLTNIVTQTLPFRNEFSELY